MKTECQVKDEAQAVAQKDLSTSIQTHGRVSVQKKGLGRTWEGKKQELGFDYVAFQLMNVQKMCKIGRPVKKVRIV